MRAAVLNSAPGRLDLEEVEIDAPGPHEVLVRTAAVGLCHSDLHYLDAVFATGLPEVLGHEAAGVVEEVGEEVRSVRPGDHVVTCLTVFCGHCRYCTDGRLSLCANRSALHSRPRPALVNADGTAVGRMSGIGGFAERMLVHENGLVTITPSMPLDRACLIGCSVMTGAGAVFRAARVRPGSDVAVFGCGGVGMAAVQGARLAGANRVVAVDISPDKLALACSMGATHTVDARDGDVVGTVRALTGGGVDYSFEAIGRRETAEQAFHALAPGGTATVLGMIPADQPLSIPGTELFLHEKRLQGSFIGSNQFRVDIPRFVDLYQQGRLRLDEMVSRVLPLEEINDGFHALRSGTVNRVVVTMERQP
ncbi:Zn-dependent alcohol dehydrogenase [Streptomyces sp. SID8352]|uniref:Zn-dependent alcohol dehydrogenase n=1 Tax=Streptomyces sp. SID8352 TaxID=2690338 RepID=UPI0013712CC0|nr:Zn-dependent alcohol dehydrogenase [Streptomyces sp. SID8352]MYU22607.1 zinc-binding dehydrogenase [Streptomyces sp. SID8352]